MKNILKGGLLAIITASAVYSSEPVNSNHSDWLEALNKTEKIRKENPEKIAKLEKEIFNQSINYKPSNKDHSRLPNYKNIKQEDIVDIFVTNAYYTTNATMYFVNRLNYDWSKVNLDKKKEFIENKARELKNNVKIQEYAKEHLSNGNMDCKLLSSIAASLELNLNKKEEVELVTGIFFDKKYAPKGEGHQWAKIGNVILDPSIEVPTDNENYIPIISVRIKEINNKYTLTPKLYCLLKN